MTLALFAYITIQDYWLNTGQNEGVKMSRSQKGSKGPGYEYWSRRPMAGMNPGAETKRLTHKLERLEAKDEIKEQIEENTMTDHDLMAEADEAMYCHEYGPCQKCKDRDAAKEGA